MKRLVLILALMLPACGDALPLYVIDGADPGTGRPDAQTMAEIEEAGNLLGVPLEFVDNKRGAVVLELVDVKSSENEGRLYLRERCWRIARAERHRVMIAHELGHALYLEHVDDKENVMAPNVSREKSVELEDWQLDIVEEEVQDLRLCHS